MALHAIDGIQDTIHPGEPLDRDIYDGPPEESAGVAKAPVSLDSLERDGGRACLAAEGPGEPLDGVMRVLQP